MKRFPLGMLCVCSALLCGCAGERQYVLNNKPLWQTVEIVSGFFDPNPYDEQFQYPATNDPAGIDPLK